MSEATAQPNRQLVITKILPSSHRGDWAITLAMLDRLRAQRPDWNLTLFARDPKRDQPELEAYGVVEAELFAKADPRMSRLRGLLRLLSYLCRGLIPGFPVDRRAERFLRACDSAEAVVFCGGGSPGGYGFANLLMHAAVPVFLARSRGVPVVFAAIGQEVIEGWVHSRLSRWVLNRAELVIVRDPGARDILRNLGVRSRAEVTADWALTLEANGVSAEVTESPAPMGRGLPRLRIGLNLRDEAASGPEGQNRRGSVYFTLM